MDLAIGDHHRPGDAGWRNVAEQAVERAEEPRRGPFVGRVRLAGLDDAYLELPEARDLGLHLLDGRRRHVGAVADVLALAAVDDQSDDAGQRLTFLVKKDRVDECKRQRGKGREPEDRAALARHQPENGEGEHRNEHDRGQRP